MKNFDSFLSTLTEDKKFEIELDCYYAKRKLDNDISKISPTARASDIQEMAYTMAIVLLREYHDWLHSDS